MNVNSMNLLDGSVGKTGFEGYVFNKQDIHGSRGVSFGPFSYDYSYRAQFNRILPGHSVHSFGVYNWSIDNSSNLKYSIKFALILGVEFYIERTR